MLKKTMTYEDYDGNERTEDLYFNLSKAEILEMEMDAEGGLEKMVDKLVKEQNNKEIIKVFKNLLLKSYGEKSLDGKHFVKSEEISRRFSQTEAYSDMFMELTLDTEAAVAFFNGIVPSK